jgi:hypothetical protein
VLTAAVATPRPRHCIRGWPLLAPARSPVSVAPRGPNSPSKGLRPLAPLAGGRALLQDGGLTALCVAANFVPVPLPYIARAGIAAHTTASQPRWSPPDHSSRRNPLGRRAPRPCSGPNLHQWVAATLVSALRRWPRSSPPTPVAGAAEEVS